MNYTILNCRLHTVLNDCSLLEVCGERWSAGGCACAGARLLITTPTVCSSKRFYSVLSDDLITNETRLTWTSSVFPCFKKNHRPSGQGPPRFDRRVTFRRARFAPFFKTDRRKFLNNFAIVFRIRFHTFLVNPSHGSRLRFLGKASWKRRKNRRSRRVRMSHGFRPMCEPVLSNAHKR